MTRLRGLSKKFNGFIISRAKTSLTNEELDELLSYIKIEASKLFISPSVESSLIRIIEAQYDKGALFKNILNNPLIAEVLFRLSSYSNYLCDILTINPEYLKFISDSKFLTKKISFEDFKKETAAGLDLYSSFDSKVNYLRIIKKREILRIGAADILGLKTLKEATLELSIIAKTLSAALFELCLQKIYKKRDIADSDDSYCLAALGKCGGNELNYSSDVDLILFYKENFLFEKAKKDFHEILSEATVLFIQTASDKTEKGYVYRVDFRLRPDGKNAPLCRSVDDYIFYYETRGEDWERQALLKLEFVGGDRKLYDQFKKRISAFISPSSFSISPLEQIAKMKKSIEKRSSAGLDVKLFKGGIRDVEFSAQALQLINGGMNKNILTGNTLDALDALADSKLLTPDEHKIFTESYSFFRKVEHFLQLMNDTQTHAIPREGEILDKLVHFLDFNSIDEFKSHVETLRAKTRSVYNSIIGEYSEEEETGLEGVPFDDPNRAFINYSFLKTGENAFGQKQFDSHTINSFLKIETSFLNKLRNSINPDIALENFAKTIKNVSFASLWYKEFGNDRILEAFVKICQSSLRSVDKIVSDKLAREYFLAGRVFDSNIESEFDSISIGQVEIYLASRLALRFIEPLEASKLLSDFIELKIKELLNKMNFKYGYFAAGLGSFGAKEMTFNSDVDLIVAARDYSSFEAIQTDFQNFLKESAGVLKDYKIDFRLRPEGQSGQLVWDIEKYIEYINNRASVWEFQALTKLRFAGGDKSLFNYFFNKVVSKINTLDDSHSRLKIIETKKMFDKQNYSSPSSAFNIKKSKGGLCDIEYALQYYALKNEKLFKLAIGKNAVQYFEALQTENIGVKYLSEAKESFLFLKKLEFAAQNIFNSALPIVPNDPKKRKSLARELGFDDVKKFDDKLKEIIALNNVFFNENLNQV